jgi:hypothetical protein
LAVAHVLAVLLSVTVHGMGAVGQATWHDQHSSCGLLPGS